MRADFVYGETMKSLPTNRHFGCSVIFTFIILAFFSSIATASPTPFPTKKWQVSTPEEQGMQSQMLADMLEVIEKNSYNIDSVLIIRNGYIVLDAYFHPFANGLRHPIHSCTKSIMSALIGIAIDKGFIKSVDQPVTDFFANRTIANMDDQKKSMTLEHLLMMASGFDCKDSYLHDWSGLIAMEESEDWAQYVLDLPMAGPPGKDFEYCNGVSYLLSAIVHHTTGMKTLDFARKYLFNPLGISEIVWAQSPQGIDIGYGRMWLKTHEMARIGWLYLNKGRWGQKQIVPAAWVEASTRGHIEAVPGDQYGYHWWVNNSGSYAAVGYKGQYIFVEPDTNMVVVFTGDLPGGTIFIPQELGRKFIIPAAVSSTSLPQNKEGTARLAHLVKTAGTSPPDGFVWLSREDGLAKEGKFRRFKSPKFMFEYPPGSKKQPTVNPFQVLRMKTPDEVHFEASVIDIPENLKLENFGPTIYADFIKRTGSDVEVLANKEMTLKCGTRAYRTDIKWVWNNYIPLTTLVVSAYKDNKCVYLATHSGPNPEKFAPIVESLTFEK
jgi:CubicO group peptidase (beta-lactamase class C family)